VRERGKSAALSFEVSLLGWSFVGASAGLYYRNHYFIVMLPAVCLLAGKAMAWGAVQLAERVRMNPLRLSAIGAAVFALGYAQALYAQRAILFELSPEKSCGWNMEEIRFPKRSPLGNISRTTPTRTREWRYWIGAGDLFLRATPFRDGVYLHLRADARAKVRITNAAGDDR